MTSYHEQQGVLTARILARVDLAGMSIADRVDLMTAISELAGLAPPGASPGITMPSTAVRHPAITSAGAGTPGVRSAPSTRPAPAAAYTGRTTLTTSACAGSPSTTSSDVRT